MTSHSRSNAFIFGTFLAKSDLTTSQLVKSQLESFAQERCSGSIQFHCQSWSSAGRSSLLGVLSHWLGLTSFTTRDGQQLSLKKWFTERNDFRWISEIRQRTVQAEKETVTPMHDKTRSGPGQKLHTRLSMTQRKRSLASAQLWRSPCDYLGLHSHF